MRPIPADRGGYRWSTARRSSRNCSCGPFTDSNTSEPLIEPRNRATLPSHDEDVPVSRYVRYMRSDLTLTGRFVIVLMI